MMMMMMMMMMVVVVVVVVCTPGGNGLGVSRGADLMFGNGGHFFLFEATLPNGRTIPFSKPWSSMHGLDPPSDVKEIRLSYFKAGSALCKEVEKLATNFSWNKNTTLHDIDGLNGFNVRTLRGISKDEHLQYRI